MGFFAMVFGMFMAILDIQIVSSSLREIQAGLAASSDEIAWVQTSYLIAEVVMIPLSGMLSRVVSTRILFAVSCGTFTIASFLCATAGSIGEMVTWRVLQGFLGGAMIPTVFATSFILFPPARRATVSVMIGLVATMAPTIGPTLGGWLTESFSWHWLFLANVPPGIIVTILVWRTVDIDKPDLSLLKGLCGRPLRVKVIVRFFWIARSGAGLCPACAAAGTAAGLDGLSAVQIPH
ncbi:MAG TPA: MFS transporter, partial [Geminicoccus sp.]